MATSSALRDHGDLADSLADGVGGRDGAVVDDEGAQDGAPMPVAERAPLIAEATRVTAKATTQATANPRWPPMDRSCEGENADPRRSVRANAAMAAGTTYANAERDDHREEGKPAGQPGTRGPPGRRWVHYRSKRPRGRTKLEHREGEDGRRNQRVDDRDDEHLQAVDEQRPQSSQAGGSATSPSLTRRMTSRP